MNKDTLNVEGTDGQNIASSTTLSMNDSQRLTTLSSIELAELVADVNQKLQEQFARLPWTHPVGHVRWVCVEDVQANSWNPNSVPGQEMKLLHTSIKEDGYTQPCVVIWDEAISKYILVDGFHRYMVMRSYPDITAKTRGYLPVVVIDKPPADRMASTVRHNRARGKHSVQGMGSLVFSMLAEGQTDAEVCNKLGMEAEELARLKHITGYSKLYADAAYSPVVLSKGQLDEKAKYARAHPGEKVPRW